MCLSGSISGRDERFCLPLAPPQQPHARATRHHWLSQTLPKPLPQLPWPHRRGRPAYRQKASEMVRPAWAASWGKCCCARTRLPALSREPSLQPPELWPSPRPPLTQDRHCACTQASMRWQEHFRSQFAVAPACVPGEARGFLRSRKLLLPSRPRGERGRRTSRFPADVLQRAAPPDEAHGLPARLQPNLLWSAKALMGPAGQRPSLGGRGLTHQADLSHTF